MGRYLKEMLYCSYDTFSIREKLVIPFLQVNILSIIILNLLYYFCSKELVLIESFIGISSIIISILLITFVKSNLALSFPSFVLVVFSYLEILGFVKNEIFLEPSWPLLQVVALIYVNFLGSTRCNFIIVLLILCSPVLAYFSNYKISEILDLQSIIYFLFPITLLLSYLKTKIYIEMLDTIEKRSKVDINYLKEQNKLMEKQSIYELGKMSSLVIHEINNPLTVILVMLSRLITENTSNDKFIKKLQKIQKQAKRINRLTTMVKKKSFSSNEKVVVNISEVVRDEFNLYSLIYGKNMISFTQDIEDDIRVNANEMEIAQILGNLLTNACHELDKVDKDNKHIELTLKSLNDYVELKISDNGSGIPNEMLNNVFVNSFSTKQRGKGTGLGLMLVDSLVQQNKGIINFSSSDQGTTFRILFPKA